MAVEKGSAFQESQLPKLGGLQFDSGGGVVNLFRGSSSFPIQLLDLPGRNGLIFKCSAFYQSDQADSQFDTWSLERPTGILGTGWSMPYERIIVDQKQNGTIEDNDYYYVINGQPAQLKPRPQGWERGVLASSYESELVAGTISSTLRQGLIDQQVLVGTSATLSSLNAPRNTMWKLSDSDSETLYVLKKQEDGRIYVCTGGYSFELFEYHYWQISYYPSYERWAIVKNDGGRYSFGGTGDDIDPGTPSNSKQYGVKWGNWSGPSDQATNQEQYVSAWNLGKVENALGNYYHVNYEVTEQGVGTGTLTYTKECHVRKVKNDLGWSAEYLYQSKTYDTTELYSPKEYMYPHKDPTSVPDTTADAYQSRYETKYLWRIYVRNAQAEVQNWTEFAYYDLWNANEAPSSWTGKSDQEKLAYGATYQRYLKSINQYTGESLGYPTEVSDRFGKPGILFDYYFTTDPVDPRGRLKTVVHPGGGKTTYIYDLVEAGTLTNGAEIYPVGSRNLEIKNPFGEGKNGTVRTWGGPDYVVCCWYDTTTNKMLMNVYTWMGHWVRSFAEWVPFTGPVDLDSVSVALSQDSFAFILPSGFSISKTEVYLYYRDPMQKGLWRYEIGAAPDTYQTSNLEVQNGRDFYVFLDNDNKVMDRITWDPIEKVWDKYSMPTDSLKKYYVTAADNYYMILAYDKNNERGTFKIAYRGLDQTWHYGTDLENVSMSIPGFGGFSYCVMQPGESFVALSIVTGYTPDGQGSFKAFDYDVRVISWDTGYVLSEAPIQNIGTGTFNNLPAYVLNTPTNIAPLIIENSSIGSGPNFIRYDGVNWTCMTIGLEDKGFTDPSHQYYWYAYGQHALLSTENTDSSIESRLLTVDPSTPTSNGIVDLETTTPSPINRYLLGYPSLNGGYITKGGTTYQQVLTTNWLTILNNVLVEIDTLLPAGDQIDYTTLINEAPDFMAFLILDENGTPKETGYILFQNGDVVRDGNGDPLLQLFPGEQIFRQFDAAHVYKASVNGKNPAFTDSFVTFPTTATSLSETPSVRIHRYSAHDLTGLIKGFVIQAIETDTGYETLSKCYQYEEASAAADAFKGEIIRFQKVSEYEGCVDPSAQQYGSITSYFYNGIPVPNTTYTSSGDLYNLLDGQLIRKEIYDNLNVQQSRESLTWHVATQIATEPDGSTLQNIYGGIPQVVETTTTHLGVTNTKTVRYTLSSGHPKETQFQYYDSQGRLILNKSVVTYAYEIEDYRGLWQKNILTPGCQHQKYVKDAGVPGAWTLADEKVQTYKLWDIVGQEIDHWGPEKAYIALNASPDPFTWWTGSTEPTESNGWQITEKTIAINEQGQVIESEDALGRHSVSVFDDSETYPLAHFGNATFADGVLYTSFEDYQTNVWSLGGGSQGSITGGDAYIGEKCYQLDANGSNASLIDHTITGLANPEQVYCFDLWYKTPNSNTEVELAIDAVGSSGPLKAGLEGTDGEWQSYQWVVDLTDLGVSGPVDVTLSIVLLPNATGYARIDQILFGPRDCRMGAQTFDPNKLRTLGGVSVNGNSQKSLYNMWNAEFTKVGVYNQTTALTAGYSVRQDPDYDPLVDAFPTDNRNVSIHLNGQEKGFYDEFRSAESLDKYTVFRGAIGDWDVEDQALKLIGGSNSLLYHTMVGAGDSVSSHVEISPEFLAGASNPSQVMYFGTKTFLIKWDGPNLKWDLLKLSGASYSIIKTVRGTPNPSDPEEPYVAWQPSWHFIIIEDRLLFMANGILVFDYQNGTVASASNEEVAIGGGYDGTNNKGVSFKNLVVLDSLQMGLGYHDGSGRLLQGLSVKSSDKVILTPTVYDDLGRHAIKVLPSEVSAGDPGVTDPFAYYAGFITNGNNSSRLWLGDPMTGPIVDTYHPESEGYPFSRTVYESSPHGRPIKMGRPGKNFAITGSPENPHITTMSYGVNDGPENFLYALPEQEYFKTTVVDPDGNKGIQYHTQAGHSVGSIAEPGGASLGDLMKSSQVHDMFGQVVASIPPNYYQAPTPIDPATGVPYGSSLYTYDFLGRPTEVIYPDSGTTKVVYDKVGRIRFSQDQKGASSNPEYFYYNKYDALGRAIEQGGYEGSWATEATDGNANDETWPTTGNINVIQTEIYDGEATDSGTGVLATPNMIGRPWKTTHYNGEGAETADITHVAAYTPAGQLDSMTREMVFNGGSPTSASRSFTYGIDGRLLSETEDVSNLTSDYTYNRVGQTTETKVTDPTVSPPNNVIKAVYDYTQLGQLKSVKPYKKDGTLLTTKDYAYLPNGWLKDSNDGFIDQDLKYIEGNCESPSSGYYNGALANNKVTYSGSGITPPTSDYCYTADYLRRVIKAQNTGGSQYAWEFDDNSNILTYTTGSEDHDYEIETNKNQLKKILSSTTSFERNFVYDENGDTTGISDNTTSLLNIEYNTTNGKSRLIDNLVTNKVATFDYGPSQSRFRKRVTDNGIDDFTALFPIPGVEVLDDGTTTQTKTHLATQGMGLVYHKEAQKFHWVLPDHLGSTRMIIDEDGTPEWVFNYDIYGSPTATSYNSPTMTFNHLFTGQYWDDELGLYNDHARFYDPSLARFLQVDPAHQGFSPYTYVGGMPNIMTDPSGKFFLTGLIGAIIGGIGYAISAAISGHWSWASLGISVGVGFVAGMVGAGVAGAITDAFSGLLSTTAGAAGYVGLQGLGGAVIGLGASETSTVLNDWAAGRKVTGAQLGKSAWTGALSGFVGGALMGYSSARGLTGASSSTWGIPKLIKTTADFDTAWDSLEEKTSIIRRTTPNVIRSRWGNVEGTLRPGGQHEWLVTSNYDNWRAMGFNYDDYTFFTSDTESTELSQTTEGRLRMGTHSGWTKEFEDGRLTPTGGHPSYTNLISRDTMLETVDAISDSNARYVRILKNIASEKWGYYTEGGKGFFMDDLSDFDILNHQGAMGFGEDLISTNRLRNWFSSPFSKIYWNLRAEWSSVFGAIASKAFEVEY